MEIPYRSKILLDFHQIEMYYAVEKHKQSFLIVMLIMYSIEFVHSELLIDRLYQVIQRKREKTFRRRDPDVDHPNELDEKE